MFKQKKDVVDLGLMSWRIFGDRHSGASRLKPPGKGPLGCDRIGGVERRVQGGRA